MIKLSAFAAACVCAALAWGQPDAARVLRYPDIHQDRLVFVHGGDLWLAPVRGGAALRLTSHDGVARWPKFSPDGKSVAFSAAYHHNLDLFVMPVEGGEPRRLTFHPLDDLMVDWRPDGRALLFRSMRESYRNRFMRMFTIPTEGGLAAPIPLAKAEHASYNATGEALAFTWKPTDRHSWKGYRGGGAPDIWRVRLATGEAEKIVEHEGSDAHPLWLDQTLYFVSDRSSSRVFNLYALDLRSGKTRQLTQFEEHAVKWPSAGPGGVVFENAGWIYRYDPVRDATTRIDVTVRSDYAHLRPKFKRVDGMIQSFDIAPDGNSVAVEARGDIFIAPHREGQTRNLSKTPGARERFPAWSADGQRLAYASDATGEFQIYVRDLRQSEPPEPLTQFKRGYLSNLRWSPDGDKLLYSDQTNRLYWLDLEDRTSRLVFHDEHNGASHFVQGFWSPDSRWIAYAAHDANRLSSIFLHRLEDGRTHRVTSRLSRDAAPSFCPDGAYLYWSAMRRFNMNVDSFDYNVYLSDPAKIVAATLHPGLPDPFAPEGFEAPPAPKPAAAEDGRLLIEPDGLEGRLANLPIPDGPYIRTFAAAGKVFYAKGDAPGANDGVSQKMTIYVFDMNARRASEVIANVDDFLVSRDGTKVLYQAKQGLLRATFGIVDATPGHKVGEGRIDMSGVRALVDYRAEWRQIFHEAWRQGRDFFYDRKMNSVDWDAVRRRYAPLLPHLAHRDDLDALLGDMISELRSSHAYHIGGDMIYTQSERVGLLGCDFAPDPESGYYRFAKIYRGENWDPENHGPLNRPGLNIEEGDYLIAVAGQEVRIPANPISFFRGTAGEPTMIAVNRQPSREGARNLPVTPIRNDSGLRYIDWVMGNLKKVDQATGGRIGYIQMMNTHREGVAWFNRLFFSQLDKDGLIIDARFNNGGFPPSFLAERLSRPLLHYWTLPFGKPVPAHTHGHHGYKALLTNSWSGSGGDLLPYYFQRLGLGPVIGGVTYGAARGISGNPMMVDGGVVTIPNFGMVSDQRLPIIENEGVKPDIFLENTPDLGPERDAQLERAIEEMLKLLDSRPLDSMEPRIPGPR